ncbi:hypothetical protein [Sodalis sp. RH16]|uniref:hypothetical protein n=1 Tax=unclassified Sodalis (in: enterobacteria) TaxID=2636512 RepID=UPI0039B54BD6
MIRLTTNNALGGVFANIYPFRLLIPQGQRPAGLAVSIQSDARPLHGVDTVPDPRMISRGLPQSNKTLCTFSHHGANP